MPSTVLVVEDEYDVRENVKEMLIEHSYNVITAINGKDAISSLRTEIPDLIISDITMPELNGYELLNYIKNSTELSIIPFFLTASSSREEIRYGISGGAEGYLTKPFKAKELSKIIDKSLNKNQGESRK